MLPAGYYTVSAQKPGFAPEQATILLDAGEWHEVVLRMARQGDTGTPAVVGVSPLSERGVGQAFFSTPHDLLLGNTRDEKEASARADAEADATRNLSLAVEAEEQRVRSAHAGYTLGFRPESFTKECSQPDWTQESLDGQGAGTVVSQKVTVTCEASVHLHYESEEQRQE